MRATFGSLCAQLVLAAPALGSEPTARPPVLQHAEAPILALPSSGQAELEVVVTGTRIPESRSRGAIATQVITRGDMQRSGSLTLEQALEAQASLQMSRTFRGTELWIRGLDPEYTLILIDGARLPGRIGGAIDLSRFPVESIERVEVVRGPSSALYGSDAIAGVVNIITRTPERPLEADGDARVATGTASAGSARIAVRPDDGWGASVSGSHLYTPEFREDEAQLATSGNEQTLNYAGARIDFGKHVSNSARFSADYTRSRFVGVDANAGGAVFDRTQLQEQALFSVNQRYQQGGSYFQNVMQYSHFRDQYLVDQRGAVALDKYEQNIEHLGQITTTFAQRWNRRHRSTLGAELLTQVMDSARLSGAGFRARYSGFAEHRWVVARTTRRDVATVVPGARIDVDSQFGTQLSPKLAIRVDPVKGLTFRAGYGRGFRAPSFQELLLRFDNQSVGYVVLGNPELTAESSHGADVSVEYRPSSTWFLSGAGFFNYLTDMINAGMVSEGTAQGTLFQYQNIASAWTRGVEALAIWAPGRLLSLTLGYTFMQTRDGGLDRPLAGRPLHRLIGRWTSQYEPWGLTFNTRASLSLLRPYFVTEESETTAMIYADPLWEVDLSVTKAFGKHFELYAGINNLANAGDEYARFTPRQGYAGVRGKY